ncbi:MAG: glycerol kinase GlpK [Rhodobacteraceae bacterium]|nr:glycerol kinase GlpK [Paracoccaceae bacterium]
MTHILAIDQGTTSSRAILYRLRPPLGMPEPVATAQAEIPQHYPASGWVEHDPRDIWASTAATCRDAIERAGLHTADSAAIGITNQRETVVVWDAATGAPIHRAIVWQDRRTAETCARMRAEGLEDQVTRSTGLLLDPYFSASKIAWLLEHVEGARARAEAGTLRFGTVDSWLIWNLTGGKVHATDATNAARTMLYDIHRGAWDSDLLALFGIPASMMPEVRDCASPYGMTRPDLFGAALPILGVAGDQQAASMGQACFEPGMIKATYGTGCFALLNTGARPVVSRSRLLTTIASSLEGRVTYALEGSIFVAGAVVQWLRDGMGLIEKAADSQKLAEASDPERRLYLVPAFTGLGAPWWDSEARGAIYGLTRNSGPADFARAALESVGYQTRDLITAMEGDMGAGALASTVLRVDGGMVASDWTMQFLADILGAPVDRPRLQETTALGAGWLAGHAAGVCPGPEGFARAWTLERRFEPAMSEESRDALHAGWREAVARTLTRKG